MLLNPRYLARYRDILRLLFKYGKGELLQQIRSQTPQELSASFDVDPSAEAQELTSDLEELGPTFVKIGQLLSTRFAGQDAA